MPRKSRTPAIEILGFADEGEGAPLYASPDAPSRNPAAVANDWAIEGANAVAGAAKTVSDFVSPGNFVSEGLGDFIKMGEERQSDVTKAAKAKLAQDVEAAGGFTDEMVAFGKYVLGSPGLTLAYLAGNIALPVGAVKGAAALGRGAAASGASAAQIAAAGTRAGTAAGAAAGGVMTGGDAAGDTYDTLTDPARRQAVLASPRAQELAAQGMAEDAIVHQVASEQARASSWGPAAVGAVFGATGLERVLAGGKGRGRIATGLIEGLQGASEETYQGYSSGKAAQAIDPSVDPWKGAGVNFAAGGIYESVPGFVLGGHREDEKPAGPLSRAADIAAGVQAGQEAAQRQVLGLPAPPAQPAEWDVVNDRPQLPGGAARLALGYEPETVEPTIMVDSRGNAARAPDEWVRDADARRAADAEMGLTPDVRAAQARRTGGMDEPGQTDATRTREQGTRTDPALLAPSTRTAGVDEGRDAGIALVPANERPSGEGDALSAGRTDHSQDEPVPGAQPEPVSALTPPAAPASVDSLDARIDAAGRDWWASMGPAARTGALKTAGVTGYTERSPWERIAKRNRARLNGARLQAEGQARADAQQATVDPQATQQFGITQTPPKRTREEAAKERKRVYREAHPFRAFLGEHGVSVDDRSDTGGERNRPVMVPFHGPLYRKNGMRLDELARRAVEAGFLTQADVDSDSDNGGVNKLSDMIRRELAGERILPVTAAESEQEAPWRADMDARYEAAQEAVDALTDDEINALLQLASDEDAELRNEEIDVALEPGEAQEGGGSTQETAAGTEASGDSRGSAEARAESPGEVERPSFDLDRQSADDIRRQEAQRRENEAKAEREAAEQAKRDAAPPAADFTLAGSDRPADQAAARGQQELVPASDDVPESTDATGKQASWVIRNKATGEVVMETFDRKKVEALNTAKYEAVPITEHLASLNRQQETKPAPTESAGDLGAGRIRAAFSSLPSVQLGVPVPLTVEYTGKPALRFMARQDQLARGKQKATIHLTRIKRGRLLRGNPEEWVRVGFRLDGKDELHDEGTPRLARPDEIKEWLEHFPDTAPDTKTRDGQPVGRDGLTDAERASNRLDGIADELAMQVQQESSERDFAPSEIPAVIEQWAKDNKVDAGELRTRVVDRLRKRLSEGRMRQVEQALSAATARAPSVAASRKPGISDFGEKIEGARKDVWASFRDKMQQASAVDIAAEPLSKSWPAPDYQALLDEGADPWAIAFMHAARDAIPTKPQKKWKVKAWVDSVRLLRNVSMGLADGRIDRARAQELLAEAEKVSRGLRDIAGRIELYQLVGHSKSLTGVRITRGEYSLYNRIAYNPPKIIWTVEKQTAATAFSNWPRELASGETKEQALANFKEKFDSLEISPSAKKETTFEVYSKRGENGYWVGKKIGRNPILLEGPFETVKEARTYKDSHNAELAAKLEKSKEVPSERRDTNRPRVGEDMRGGADVTPQMFEDAFGFKGVQFGNYVEQGRRQKDLNDAYDALMDMAAILGVPPKALSLNGELGLAFGARGKGGKGAATAHYEHEQVVINLTKREGAGSLGHEWWHALDNYFSRMRSAPTEYMTEGSDVALAAKGSDFVRPTAVRREMVQAFGEVLKAIRSTAIKARASKLDAKRTKAYWTTSPEMSARAFESFLISKLQDQGASNDYLANIVDEATWAAAEKLGFELEGSYPYPTAGEVPAIRAAFEHFFQVVETRETDSGIALHEPSARYSVHEPQRPTQQIDLPLAEGGGASSGRPGLPGPDNRARRSVVRRVEATPEVRFKTTPDPAGVYLARTELVAERHRTIHADRVTTPQEAAVALASVADYAVEHFHGLVTDKAGKPLALVGMFKGAVAETRVYAETIYAEAFRVKGAANIWFTHNHPSGKAEFSAADRTLFSILRYALQGTGIEPRGFFAQTSSRGTGNPGAWVFTDSGHDTIQGQVLPADAASKTAVPVVERVIVEQEPRAAITSSAVAKDAARAMQTTLGTDAPFVMLMSAQHEPIGAYPLKPGELAMLREGERAANLFRAVSTANAGASILVDPRSVLTDAELDNVAGALSVATGQSPLDALVGKNLASRLEAGAWRPPHGSFFSRRRSTKDTYESRIDALFAGEKAAGPREGVKVLDRSDVLALLGFGEGPVHLAEGKVIRGRESHPRMTAEAWKKVPDWLENPAAVLDSDTVPGALVFIAPDVVGGATVRMTVEPRKDGKGVDVHVLTNAYDAPGFTPFARWFRDGMGRFVDQKTFPTVLERSGLRLSSSAWQNKPGTRKILTEKNLAGYRRNASPASAREGADTGLPTESVTRVADAMRAQWANGPDAIVVESIDDPAVPLEVREAAESRRADTGDFDAEGFFHEGTVYLVADQLDTEADVARVLLHEAAGHYGLRGLFGDRLGAILDQIIRAKPSDVARKMREYGLTGAEGRRLAAEEVLASMAQTNPQAGFVRRAIAAIRSWLREIGFDIKLSDNDIIVNVLVPARQWVESRAEPSARQSAPVFSARNDRERDAFVSEALAELAENDELFRYPVSRKATLDGVMADVFPRAAYLGEDTRVDEREESGADARHVFRTPEGKMLYVFERGNEVWIDVSRLEEGERGGGFYAGVLNYAHNAKKRLIGDPAGLSEAAVVRRTSAMLSSALRFGTTRHMDAAPEQLAGIPDKGIAPLKWQGDDLSKVTALIDSFLSTLYTQFPDLKALHYDFRGNRFVDSRGRPVDAARLERGEGSPAGRRSRAGQATLRRGIFLKSLVESESGARPELLENILSRGYSLTHEGGLGAMFSRRETKKKLSDNIADLFKSHKGFNWWHKTIGTQYEKAQRNAHFGRVFERAQNYLNDISDLANRAADAAPSILPQLNGIRDVLKKPVSKKDLDAIAAPIFQGTLADADPAKGKVFTDAELRRDFKLNDAQIGLYREFRAAVDQSLDDLAKTDVLRYVGKDVSEAVRQQAHDASGVMQAANILAGELGRLAQADPKRADALNDEANTVLEKARRAEALMRGGYAPLMRFGRYSVYVTRADEQVYFGMFESEREANRMARRFREDPEYADADVSQGVMSQEAFKIFQGVSPETLELFGEVAGIEKSEIFQQYLKLTRANRSAMKRLINRKGVAGFSEDTSRVLASFITSNARAGSANLHMGAMTEAVESVPKDQGDVKDEAVRLAEFVKGANDPSSKLRGLLFMQYLGGSVASAFVNLTQSATTTYPYLSQFAGAGGAATHVTRAMRNAVTGVGSDKDLASALAKAESEGIVSPQEIHHLYNEAGIGLSRNPHIRRLTFLWGSLFSAAEQFNRRVSFIAAYRIGRQNKVENPYEFARKAVDETQFIYSRASRPNWARNPVGASLMLFRSFTINYLEFLKRLPPKQQALAMVVLMLAAGLEELPFADDLDDVIDTAAQAMGYNWNTKRAKREFLVRTIGADAADFVLRGVSTAGIPLDVSARLGLGNLLPGTGMLLGSTRDKTREVTEVLGAPGSFFQSVAEGAGKALAGDTKGAGLEIAPLAVRNVLKGLDMYQTGMYRDSRGRRVMDVDAYDAAVKAIGFQPAQVAAAQRKAGIVIESAALVRNVKARISEQMAEARFERDPEKMRDAREALRDWNRKNPEARILIDESAINRRLKAMRATRAERLVKSTPKEIRRSIAEQL